jgi:hypothetical protein
LLHKCIEALSCTGLFICWQYQEYVSPSQLVKGLAGGYFFTTFAKQKIQLWEEVIKKPRKVKYSKGLLEKQDLPVKRKLQVTNLRLKRKAKQLSG